MPHTTQASRILMPCLSWPSRGAEMVLPLSLKESLVQFGLDPLFGTYLLGNGVLNFLPPLHEHSSRCFNWDREPDCTRQPENS